MNDPDWMDAKSACARLGVKAQTLYAYVSRRRIRMMSDPGDARKSLYSRRDIDTLVVQKRRPRARADVAQAAIRWGDPVMATAISEVRDGTIRLRGRAIEDCAEDLSLEQVTALLCGVQSVSCPSVDGHVTGRTPFSRAMKALAAEAETARPMLGRSRQDIAREAGRMIALVADACLGRRAEGPAHLRVGSSWGLDAGAQNVVRRALVLLSDHELNPSTFAVRVCASTGAPLPAALLAGMATLSGPRHAGVAALTRHGLDAALEGRLKAFLDENSGQDPYRFGFGHPLYPDGDPRAVLLLSQIPEDAPARQAVNALSASLALDPNIDAALAAMADHFSLPEDAASTIFSIGRAAGWIAHAIEQVQSGDMIRPRAKYLPESAPLWHGLR